VLIIPSILTFKIDTCTSEGSTFIYPVFADEPFETNRKFKHFSDHWFTVVTKLLNQVEPVTIHCDSSNEERAQAAHTLKHRMIQQFRMLGFDVYGHVKTGDDHDTHELVFALEDTEESKYLGNISLIPQRIVPCEIKRVLTNTTLRDYYHVGDVLVWDKACWRIAHLKEGIRSMPCHLEDGSLGLEHHFVVSMNLKYLGEASMRQMDVLEEAANKSRYPNRRMVRGLDPLREFVVPQNVKIAISSGDFDFFGRLNVKIQEVVSSSE